MAFVIASCRYYSNEPTRRALALNQHGEPVTFCTRAKARAWIEKESAGVYRLDHDEYARPTYQVRDASKLSANLAAYL